MKTLPLPMYTIREAERTANLRPRTAYYYIARGDLEAVREHEGWRIPYDALVRFVTQREAKNKSR